MISDLLNGTSTSEVGGPPNAAPPRPHSPAGASTHFPPIQPRKSASPTKSPRPPSFPARFPAATTPRQTQDMDMLASPMSSPQKAQAHLAPSSSIHPFSSSSLTSLGQAPSSLPPTQGLLPSATIDSTDDVDTTNGNQGEDREQAGEEDMEDGEEGDGENDGDGRVWAAEEDEGTGSDDEEEEEGEEEEDEESDGAESEDLEEGTPEPEFVRISGPNGEGDVALPVNIAEIKVEPGDSAPPASSTDGIPSAAEEVTNVLVPKKKRARRSPSSDEDLPPAPPPMQTIRLERQLDPEGSTLEWNILDDAREKGMVDVWGPVDEEVELVVDVGLEVDGSAALPAAGPVAGLLGLGGDDEDEVEIARRFEEKFEETKKIKIKRKKIDYDLEDPFIDDSELLIDAPTHFGRPKKDGFFVHSGPLELLEESPQKARPKPQVKRNRPSAAGPSRPRKSLAAMAAERLGDTPMKGEGTRTSPLQIDSDTEGKARAGPSRSPPPESAVGTGLPSSNDPEVFGSNSTMYKSTSTIQIYRPPFPTFPQDVRARLIAIRKESDMHNWDALKNKFPEHLKPVLRAAGVTAMRHDMFGERDEAKGFYMSLPSVLPYNQFTLAKLITKLCHDKYWDWLQECENEGIREFGELVERDRDSWVTKYEDSVRVWEDEVKTWDESHPRLGSQDTPMLPSSEPINVDDIDVPAATDGRPRPPPKRFTWNAEMRDIFQQLLDNQQEMIKFTQRASEFGVFNAHTDKDWTEGNMRSRLYKRISDLFPVGYMNTGAVSREMSKLKKQNQKAQAAD